MKKVLLFVSVLLSLSGMVKASSVQELTGYACGKCVMKLPENLVAYKYVISSESLYNEEGKYIGFVNIEEALKNAGIKNFKIDYGNASESEVYFDVITDSPLKKIIPAIISGVAGLSKLEGTEIDGIPTRVLTDCQQKAYNMALDELTGALYVDGYDISIDKKTTPVYREDLKSAELSICLKSEKSKDDVDTENSENTENADTSDTSETEE